MVGAKKSELDSTPPLVLLPEAEAAPTPPLAGAPPEPAAPPGEKDRTGVDAPAANKLFGVATTPMFEAMEFPTNGICPAANARVAWLDNSWLGPG